MTFVWPPMLLAVLIVPLGVIVARRIDDRRRQRMAALSGQGWSGGGRNSRLLDRLPGVLTVAAFVMLAVALARPQATVSLHLAVQNALATDAWASVNFPSACSWAMRITMHWQAVMLLIILARSS